MRNKTVSYQRPPTRADRPSSESGRWYEDLSLGTLGFARSASKQAVAESTRSLAVLVGAHMPVSDALHAVASQCNDTPLRHVLDDVCQHVQDGRSLSASLRAHPQVFSDLYVHLVEVGEAVGSLGPVLRRLADYLERSQELRRKVRLALVYPGLIVSVAVGAISFMLTVIVPTFAEMFEGFGAELPAATQRVIAVSSFLTGHALATLATVVGLILCMRWVIHTEAGKAKWHAFQLRAPLVGGMLRKGLAARFCRTLGTLLQRGVSLSKALRLLTHALSNTVARRELERMTSEVERGVSLSTRLLQSEAFPPLVGQMIMVGEKTARLDETLLHVADLYEEELDNKIETLTSVIEPLLIIFIGLVLGAIMIALYLPLFDLVTVVQ